MALLKMSKLAGSWLKLLQSLSGSVSVLLRNGATRTNIYARFLTPDAILGPSHTQQYAAWYWY